MEVRSQHNCEKSAVHAMLNICLPSLSMRPSRLSAHVRCCCNFGRNQNQERWGTGPLHCAHGPACARFIQSRNRKEVIPIYCPRITYGASLDHSIKSSVPSQAEEQYRGPWYRVSAHRSSPEQIKHTMPEQRAREDCFRDRAGMQGGLVYRYVNRGRTIGVRISCSNLRSCMKIARAGQSLAASKRRSPHTAAPSRTLPASPAMVCPPAPPGPMVDPRADVPRVTLTKEH